MIDKKHCWCCALRLCVFALFMLCAQVVFAQGEEATEKTGEAQGAGVDKAKPLKSTASEEKSAVTKTPSEKEKSLAGEADGKETNTTEGVEKDAQPIESEGETAPEEKKDEAVPDNKKSNTSGKDEETKNAEDGDEESTNEEEAEKKELTEDEKSIVQSIKVSTDKDLVLWLSGLGLGINGGRSEHESALLEYYKLPSDALVEKPEEPEEADKDTEDGDAEKDSEKESESADSEDDEEKSEKDGEEEEKKKLITSEVTKPIAEGETTSISITNADDAKYFTYEKVDEHIFILKGNVEVIVQQENKKRLHRITSNKLVYNETLRVGSAVGNVKYRMYSYDDKPPTSYSENATEEFTGSVVSFSIDEFNSDVVHGIAYTENEVKYGVKKSKKETLSFKIFAPHISKSPQDVITISNASLTSSTLTPPLYRIRLRKMWVLNASGEWAIARATIFLGDIPVLWFPFFVNPGDKFFFHPAIGFKLRGGGFINTTTFLIGKPKKKDDEGGFLDIFNISKSKKDTRKIIKGLYLREPEAGDLVRTYPPKWELKYILDYYTNVGLYSALEGSFPQIWKFDTLSFAAGIGYSHTVYNIKDAYFNNHIDEKGKLSWNLDHGYIFNIKVPFRYNFKVDTKLNFGSAYTTSLLFEQYSDAFIQRDFFQRAFDFDWQQVLDPNKGIKDLNARPSEISSYYWKWNNDITIPTNKIIGNYLESISISNLRFQMDWKKKSIDAKHHPKAYKNKIAGSSVAQKIEGSFFHPSQIEIPNYSLSASGTLFSLDSTKLDFSNGWEKTIFAEAEKKRKEDAEKKVSEEGEEEGAPKGEGTDTPSNAAEGKTAEAAGGEGEGAPKDKGTDTPSSAAEGKTAEAAGGEGEGAPKGEGTDTPSSAAEGDAAEAAAGEEEGAPKGEGADTPSSAAEGDAAEAAAGEEEGAPKGEGADTPSSAAEGDAAEAAAGEEEAEVEKLEDIAEYVPVISDTAGSMGNVLADKADGNTQSPKVSYDVVYPKEEITKPAVYDFDWKKITLLFTYKVDHSLNEKLYLKDKKWLRPEDFDFFADEFVDYGYLTTDNTFTLTQKFTTFDSLFSYSWDISLDLKRRFLNTSDKLPQKDKDIKEKNAIDYTKEDISNKHTVSIFPLKMFSPFSATKVSYVANFDIGKNVLSTKEPAKFYEHDDVKWWKNHTVEQRYVAKYANITNTLGLDIELPPRLDAYTPSYAFDLDTYFKFSMKTKIFKKKDQKDKWFYDPLNFSGTILFFEQELSLTQELNFNYEESYVKDVKTTLKIWWFSLDFIARRDKDRTFDVNNFAFNKTGNDELRPSTVDASFKYDISNIWFWRDRINLLFNIDLKYSHDFLEFTNTKLSLSYKFELSIHKILKLSFSVQTQNDLMFLYYEDYAKQIGVPVRNFWKDIVDGLNLFDIQALKRTPFKLDKLSLGITQDFGGWVLDVVYSGNPKRKTEGGIVRYEWQNTLEFGVYWKPISDLKTSVFYREEKLSLDEEIKKQ